MDANDLRKFSFFDSVDLPNRGVEATIHSVRDYPFIITHVFGCSDEEDDLRIQMGLFLKEYIINWILSDPKENRNSSNLSNALDFALDQFKLHDVYGKISDGNDWAEVALPVSNATFKLRRLGDCLGIGIFSSNPGKEVHQNGLEIVKQMCGKSSHPRELIHSIEMTIPIPRAHGENNSVIIDFGRMQNELEKACPYIAWKLTATSLASSLIDAYKLEQQIPVNIGSCKGLEITGSLVHCRNKGGDLEVQWRRGNVQDEKAPFTYRFLNGKDLCFSLSVQSGLKESYFLDGADINLNVSQIQSRLLGVGYTILEQLRAMEACRFLTD